MPEPILALTHLSQLYDDYLVKANQLEMLRIIGSMNEFATNALESQCWEIRKDALRTLVKVYDANGNEKVIRKWAQSFGWRWDQLDPSSPTRQLLVKDAAADARLADQAKPGGAADPKDANPVEAEHVYVQMAKNFPPEAIEWIRRARWTGPQNVPMDRIDQDDRDKWAASHQPGKVKEFEKMIQAHDGHVAPSVLVQEAHSPKAFIVDGHHRALARENLKQDVLGYVGNIDAKDRQAALETHTHQIHQGNDPKNA